MGLAFVLLGTAWAFASPPGSTNDEEYHLANVWCAWGEWEGCRFKSPEAVPLNGSEFEGAVWIPEFLRSVNCYQRGTQSTECLRNKSELLVDSFRQGYQYNPSGYYVVMRALVWNNGISSLQVIRLFNVLVTGLIIGLAVFTSSPKVRRGLILAWGIAAIPWVVIYASSSNPSAWVIVGVGCAWAFLLSLLDGRNTHAYRWLALVGFALSIAIAVSARFDGLVWVCVSTVAVFAYVKGKGDYYLPSWLLLSGGVASVVVGLIALRFNWSRLGFSSFSIPEWNRATDQMHPLLKDISELPWWIASFWGAQPPTWIPANGEPQSVRDGFVPVALIGNLGDSYFPSIVGYLLGFAAVALVFTAIPRFSRRNWAILGLLGVSLLVIVFAFRAKSDFVVVAPIQNRYFLPWLMLVLAFALTVRGRSRPLLSRGQAIVIGTMLVIGGSLAWLAFASRYAVNLSGTYTNFGQDPVWWWPWGPSRLVWFLIAVVATTLWVVVTLRYAAKPLNELDRVETPPDRVV